MGHQIKTWRCCCCLKVVDLSPPRVWAGANDANLGKKVSTQQAHFHNKLLSPFVTYLLYASQYSKWNPTRVGIRIYMKGHSAMIFVCSDKPWFLSPENVIFDQKLINQTLDQIKTFYKSSSFQGFEISILCTQFCIWMNSSEFRGRYWDETWANLSIYLRMLHCQPLDGNMRNHSLCQCNAMVGIFQKRGKFGFWDGATPLCYIILNLFQWQRKKNLAGMCHILCLVKTNKPKKVKITIKSPVSK